MITLRTVRHRVLYCSTALAFGGEQKQLAQILSHLDRQRFKPIICCIRSPGRNGQAMPELGAPVLCLGARGPYDLPRAVLGLRRVIRRHHIDLLHMGIFGSELPGLMGGISAGVPVVAVLQSTFDPMARASAMGGKGASWHLKWQAIYAAHSLLAKAPRVRFVALSPAVKDSAVRHLRLPPEHVSVIPLGLDPKEFDGSQLPPQAVDKVRVELGLDGAYPVLLNTGRLSPAKGQVDLVRVMPMVLERFPRARLLIAGDGDLMPDLTALRNELGLQDSVLLLGRRDDIGVLLGTSDIFVFGSHYEGLPGAVIEAMAAGKSVICFDIPSMRAVVEDGRSGVLVPGRDIRRFAEAVVDLAEHRYVSRIMGEKARQIVGEQYDIRQNVKSLEAVYEQMLVPA